MIFLKHLKELRKNKKLSQEEVCRAIFVNQKTYSRYELGTSEPNFETLKKIADYFDVSIDYLLDYKSSEQKISFTRDEMKNFIKVINMLNSKIN